MSSVLFSVVLSPIFTLPSPVMLLIEPEPEMVTVSLPLLASSVFRVPLPLRVIVSAPPFVVI